MKYIINPCNACHKKIQNRECNINDLNDCYAETLAAYQRYPNNFVILGGDAKDNWKQCMSNKMETLPYVAGKPRTFCNFQLNAAPVFVGDHFFPSKLYDYDGDADKALNACKLECKNVRNKNECAINCQVDFDALEKVENYEYKSKSDNENVCDPTLADEYKEKCEAIDKLDCGSKQCCYDDTLTTKRKLISGEDVPVCYKKFTPKTKSFDEISKDKPVIFYTIFIITALALSVILFVSLFVLLNKNISPK
jgi:hypothetical protein